MHYQIVLKTTSCSLPRWQICIPSKYNDFIPSDVIIDQSNLLDCNKIAHPISITLYSLLHAFVAIIDSTSDTFMCSIINDDTVDPINIHEARHSKYWNEWLIAMHNELELLKAKKTYVPIQSVPPGQKAIQCKWVLHIKHDKTNAISHFKAQLVVKGFNQIPGQDFHYIFVPVAHWDSICAILSIATINDYELHQLDVKTTYLNGPLDEEIYMQVPPRLDAPFWHLCKGLYGLHQAGRQWDLTLH